MVVDDGAAIASAPTALFYQADYRMMEAGPLGRQIGSYKSELLRRDAVAKP